MTKNELLERLRRREFNGKQLPVTTLDAVLRDIGEEIRNALAGGEDVALPGGIGKLSVKQRAERRGRNPRTGEDLTIPACRVAIFAASRRLREALKG